MAYGRFECFLVIFVLMGGVFHQLWCMKTNKKDGNTSSWSRCTKYGSRLMHKIQQEIMELNNQKVTMPEEDYLEAYELLQDYYREIEQNLECNIRSDEIEEQKKYFIKQRRRVFFLPISKKLKLSQKVWDEYMQESKGANSFHSINQESDVYNLNFSEAVKWYATLTKKREEFCRQYAFNSFSKGSKKHY